MKNFVLKIINLWFLIARALRKPFNTFELKIISVLAGKGRRGVIRQALLDLAYWINEKENSFIDVSEEICIGLVNFIEFVITNPKQFLIETVMYTKIAWRNLFRNTRRTLIAGFSIGLGLAALITMDAYMKGMFANQIESATASFTGEAQVHSLAYKDEMEVHQVIENIDSVEARLANADQVKDFSKRVVLQGMLSSATKSQGIAIWGIDTTTEKALSMMDDRLSKESKYLPNKKSVLIGQGLADELNVKLGDRLRLTVAEAHTGEPSQRLVKVGGIYSFGSKDMDMMVAAIHDDLAREMAGIPEGSAHEIAFTLNDKAVAYDSTNVLWGQISGDGNITEPWPEIMEELKTIIQLSDKSMGIIGFILFLIVTLSIINTLFMSIYERFFEFGVLKAVGTNARQLFQMVLLEAASLGVLSIILGMGLGYLFSALLAHNGINYNDMNWGGVTFYEKIYPVIELKQYIVYPYFVLLFTVVVSMYPAFFAARMKPAEALKRSI